MSKKNAAGLSQSAQFSEKVYIFACYAFAILLTLSIIFPILHVIASSMSSVKAISAGRVWFWPVEFSLTGYSSVFRITTVWIGYRNSLMYVVLTCIYQLANTVLLAYPLSRKGFLLKGPITTLLLISMLFSGGMIPSYILILKLGLLNTIWAIVLPSAIAAFNIFLLRNYISSNIPEELYEASIMDGCSHIKYLIRIVLPLSVPVLATLTLWTAVAVWNSYFSALLYLQDVKLMPLQVLLNGLLNDGESALMMDLTEYAKKMEERYQLQYGLIIVACLPMVLLYPFIQRFFIKGIMIGSVKG